MIRAAAASNIKPATTSTALAALAFNCGISRTAPSTAVMTAKTAKPVASIRAITPRSEKYTATPYLLSRRRGNLEFRWALGQQGVGLEGTMPWIAPFDHHLRARAENIRYNSCIGHGQRLLAVVNDKCNAITPVVAHNRPLLHNTGHAHVLRCTGAAMHKFRYRHIIDGVGLRVRVDKIENCAENSRARQQKTHWQTLLSAWRTRRRRSFQLIFARGNNRLHDTTSLNGA